MTRIHAALWCLALVAAWAPRSGATDAMQKQARKLGFKVTSCHYCHASAEAEKKMAAEARRVGVPAGNCIVCHGRDLPATLNPRGQFLVDEKARRHATGWDMAWLKDYVEPEPSPSPKR